MEILKILWYNWRCIHHPLAGGAEAYIHKIARRLAKQGHKINFSTSKSSNQPKKEDINGYTIIRIRKEVYSILSCKKDLQ